MKMTPGLLACETYSVRQLFADGKLTLETAPAFWKELGIPGLALNDMFFTSWDDEYLDRVRRAAEEHGRVIMGLIMGANLVTPDEAARQQNLETVRQRMRAAARLGCSIVRIDTGSTGSDADDETIGVERAIAAFRELLPLAKELGLKMTIENHGGVSRKADSILRIIKGTDPEWVGACLDFGNWPDEIRYQECEKLAAYCHHTHAKALNFDEHGEDPRISFGRIIGMLRAAGYEGALSIEFEGAGDQVEGVKKSRDLILKYWPAVAVGDADIERLVPKSSILERVATGFGFTEGPAWDGEQFLYFTDIPNSTIHRMNEAGKVSAFLKPSAQANGLCFDREGRLIACRHEARNVVRVTTSGKVEVIADSFNGKKLNSPNDCIVARDGSIYFSDPIYGLEGRKQEQPVEGVYRITPDGLVPSGAEGKIVRVVDDMVRPNGLHFSPDGKTLYVADSQEKKLRAYSVKRDGTVENGRDFASMASPDPGGPDGMAVDAEGNLYCTGAGGIWMFTPKGQHLGTIRTPETPANCTFGGPDLRTLYITARTSVYRIRLANPGMR
jgi:gluconolactonase